MAVQIQHSYRAQYGESWALVIGINQYKHICPLDIACADAESVAEILVGELGFPEANVSVLKDHEATRFEVAKRFSAFDSLSADDRLFVFFAGHGITVPGQRGPVGYLVPVDGKLDDKSTLIRWDELTRNAEIIAAKHILFVMDACYSGLAIRRATSMGEQRFVSDMLQRFSRQVITAGKADETVADGGGPTGKNSIFTGHLIEGLKGRAANESGVLTASYLMDYVYKHVGNDPRSTQTPHFGHLEGDGDFILRTPNREHLPGGTKADFLVKPVVERPEPPTDIPSFSIKPIFAEKNGYADPEAENFGKNDWAKKLGRVEYIQGLRQIVRAPCWLSLVVEPVSNQPIDLNLVELAKTLPRKQYGQFVVPSQVITTAKSLILYEPENLQDQPDVDCWKRFLRLEKSGALEYCDFTRLADTYSITEDGAGIKIFHYVLAIGTIWTFLFAAKDILKFAGYELGVRYLINLIGAKDSILVQFADKPGEENKTWRQPLGNDPFHRGQMLGLKCRDANLQMTFKVVLSGFGEAEAKALIVGCAEHLTLAYNHQSKPRCFNYGTDTFPWNQFHPDY